MKVFKTGSSAVAAFLLANDLELIKSEETKPGHVDFFFADPGNAQELADRFYSSDCSKYWRSMREIKMAISRTLGVQR